MTCFSDEKELFSIIDNNNNQLLFTKCFDEIKFTFFEFLLLIIKNIDYFYEKMLKI